MYIFKFLFDSGEKVQQGATLTSYIFLPAYLELRAVQHVVTGCRILTPTSLPYSQNLG